MKSTLSIGSACLAAIGLFASIAVAAPPPPEDDNPASSDAGLGLLGDHHRSDPSAPMIQHDEATAGIVSDAPSAKVTKNLAPAGRGARLETNATTDVWALGNYAYTGTFDVPCGGDPENPNGGVFIWDVHNKNKVTQAGFIPSPEGSRSNDELGRYTGAFERILWRRTRRL